MTLSISSETKESVPAFPRAAVKQLFERFSNDTFSNSTTHLTSLSKHAVDDVQELLHVFMQRWEQDVVREMSSRSGSSKGIEPIDIVQLMSKRHMITDRQPLTTLARELLPAEYVEEIDSLAGSWGHEVKTIERKKRQE